MKKQFLFWILVALLWGGLPGFAESLEFPFTGQVTAKDVNIRAGQDKSFELLGNLNQGDQVVVVQQSFSWYKIKLPEKASCYVHRKFVHLLQDQVGEINADRVNIRARPSLNAVVIGQLSKMTKVRIKDAKEEWYQIDPVEGVYGWVMEEFVAFKSKEVPEPQAVTLPSRNVYEIKRQEEARLKAEEAKRLEEEAKQKLVIRGTVTLLQTPLNENVRHQVVADDGQTFYLMGYRSVLDGFLNHRVQVEGLPQAEAQAACPVLLVLKVQLVI